MKYLLLAFFIASGLGSTALAAQEQVPLSTAEAPLEVREDAQEVREDCEDDRTQSAHYDCACLSERFIEERLRAGSGTSQYSIMVGIMDECFNIPGAAAYSLDRCEGSGRAAFAGSFDDGTSFEEFCQCVSANYALEFADVDTSLTQTILNRLATRSLLRCQVPNPGDRNVFPRLDL